MVIIVFGDYLLLLENVFLPLYVQNVASANARKGVKETH